MKALEHWKKWVLVLAIGLAGCLTQPPTTSEPGIYPTKIYDTTKVSDEATRKALTSFDSNTGVLRFASSTPVLDNLKTNDVLVSDISEAAPYGYLRRVKGIRKEGNEVVIDTEQAKLTDAVQSGTLAIESSKVQTTNVSQQGVRPQLEFGYGAGFLFDQAYNKTLCLKDISCNTASVQVGGKVRASIGYRAVIGIDYRFPASFVGYFEASAGADIAGNLEATAQFNGSFDQEETVDHKIEIIKGSIGPVPVVIVVHGELLLGANGNAEGKVSAGISPTLSGLVGMRWDSEDGFRFFTPQASLTPRLPNPQANAQVHAYVGANVQFLLYGVFGPSIKTKAGGEVEAGFPRDPLWSLFARFYSKLDFQGALPILNTNFDLSKVLLDKRFRISDAPIQPPTITLSQPLLQATYKKATDFSQFINTSDPQGRKVTVVGSSSGDGTLASLTHAFATPGPRVLTFTAGNGEKSAQAQMNVDAVNYPPSVQGAGSSSSTPLGIPLFLSTNGYDLNEPKNHLDCSKMHWSVSGSDIVTTETGSSFGCQPKISFSETGSRTLSVTATDPEGLNSTQNIAVDVTARPAQLPPLVDRIGVVGRNGKLQSGQEVLSRENLVFSVAVDNPDNSPVNFEWSVSQVPRPEDCTPIPIRFCLPVYTPARQLSFSQNQPSITWNALSSDIPGFKFPTEKQCVPVFGQGKCQIQDVPVSARLLVSLNVSSPVAPTLIQTRTFILQLSPQDIGPK